MTRGASCPPWAQWAASVPSGSGEVSELCRVTPAASSTAVVHLSPIGDLQPAPNPREPQRALGVRKAWGLALHGLGDLWHAIAPP